MAFSPLQNSTDIKHSISLPNNPHDSRIPSSKHDLFGPIRKDSAHRQSSKSIRINLVAQALIFSVQVGSTIALSRILAPEEFGLIAMSSVITNFVGMFRDAGLTQATIQKESINEEQMSTLFWINMVICSLLSLAVVGSAPFVAWLYQEPRLTWITVALAAPLFVSGFGLQHQALLMRHMRFQSIAIAEVIAIAVAVSFAVWAALDGWGVWALVAMPFIRHALCSILLMLGTSWIPNSPVKGSGVRSMLKLGMNITGFNMINYFARTSDNFIIGKFFGPTLLGQYSRAYGLMTLPLSQINAPISRSLLPTLARLTDSPKEYQKLYLFYSGLLAWFLSIPIAIAALFGEPLFIFLLGPEWQVAGQIFEWLAIASVIQPLTSLTGLVFVTSNRTRMMLWWGLFNSIVVVSGFAIGGLLNSVMGIAQSYAITNFLLAPICFAIAFRNSPIAYGSFLSKISTPLIISGSILCLKLWL